MSGSSIDNLQSEVAGYLSTLKEEKQAKLKKSKVSKESNLKFRKSSKKVIGGAKQKKFKKFSKSQLNSFTNENDTSSEVPVIKKSSSVLDNLPLPTQQLVSSFLPWYEVLSNEPTGDIDGSFELVDEMKTYSKKLLELESKCYQGNDKKIQKDTNSSNWVKTAASAGTTKDRIAALSVLAQEAPLHNLRSFETLLNMSRKNVKRDTLQGIQAIKNILLKSLLPDNRRLRQFHQHPLHEIYEAIQSKGDTPTWSLEKCQQMLIVWAFEDKLKQLVNECISLISLLSRDPLAEAKKKAMNIAWHLLDSKPEGEREFLAMIVNKLGDPMKDVSSSALHYLHKLTEKHPLMQSIIVKAVRDLLLVPKLTIRVQHYCIGFLTAQIFSNDKKELAEAMLKIYLNFFKSLIHKNEKSSDASSYNKMIAELLTGVSRALPFVQMNNDVMGQINELYKATHHPNMNTVTRAFCILLQIVESRQLPVDRFFNSLYKAFYHPELAMFSARHNMFLHLLFRALKFDPSDNRRDAFVKRLLQITSLHRPAFTAAALTTISELMRANPVFCQRILYTPMKKSEDEKLSMFEDDGDGEEQFYDVDENGAVAKKKADKKQAVKSSWVHKTENNSEKAALRDYDPTYVNPMYCGVEKAAFWELHILTRHFHPTVALYAKTLLSRGGTTKPFSGDPLVDFSNAKFLERFVYRNPKNVKKDEEGGAILHYYDKHSRMRFKESSHRYDIPANTTEFLEKKKFFPEDAFFQKYFSNPSVINRHRKKKKAEVKVEEHRGLTDEDFDDFINSADGQKQTDKNIKFFEHVSKDSSSKKNSKIEFESDDEDMEDNWETGDMDDEGFQQDEDLKEEEINHNNSAGVFITGGKESKKRRGNETKILKPKKRKMIANELGDMLAENALSEFDTTSGAATIVKDGSSAKQLRWERKQEVKNILDKKRKRKLSDQKQKKKKGLVKKSKSKVKKHNRVKK